MPEYAVRTVAHTCGHCHGKGTTGFWVLQWKCKLCDGAGKIFSTEVVWPMGTEKGRSPIRRHDAIDVEALPPDAHSFMHERPRRPPRR